MPSGKLLQTSMNCNTAGSWYDLKRSKTDHCFHCRFNDGKHVLVHVVDNVVAYSDQQYFDDGLPRFRGTLDTDNCIHINRDEDVTRLLLLQNRSSIPAQMSWSEATNWNSGWTIQYKLLQTSVHIRVCTLGHCESACISWCIHTFEIAWGAPSRRARQSILYVKIILQTNHVASCVPSTVLHLLQ